MVSGEQEKLMLITAIFLIGEYWNVVMWCLKFKPSPPFLVVRGFAMSLSGSYIIN
jgi:hypothetical protein